MTCPSADTLAGFVAASLDLATASATEAHIDTCEACRAALSAAVRGAAPVSALGRYRLETVLGAGGMGLVYRAHDPQLDRAVAIKVVRRDGDDAAQRARLVREAQSLARLSHPHVCHVYDVGEHDGEVWVAMELIDGTDLLQWSQGQAPAAILAALVDAARGLAAAHAAGLIHRDVKPQNTLVARDGRVVVTDFGLARDEQVTTTGAAGAIRGTPAYLAPEQLTGGPIDARVDQFAWALMAWELLCGVRPFPIEPAARLAAIRAGVVAPRTLAPALGAALARALAAAPRDRFESMTALVAALAPAPRRRRAVIGGAVAILGGAIAVGAVALGGARGGAPATITASGSTDARDGSDAGVQPDAPGDPGAATAIAPGATGTVAARTSGTAPPAIAAPPAITSIAAPAAPAASPAIAPPGAPPDVATAPAIPAIPVDAAPPAPATHGFDRARAERVLADCRFPVDPAHPDRALAAWGSVVDWGPVTRRERVLGTGSDGEHAMSMFEVEGARARYRFDGDSAPRLGSLDAAVGDLVVVCPFALPATALVDHRELPAGWRTPSPPVYAFAPTASAPRIATSLAALAPLNVPDAALRDPGKLPRDRALLVWARPRKATGDRWDMGGWDLDAAGLTNAELLAADRPLWLVVDHPEASGARATFRGVIALRRMLE